MAQTHTRSREIQEIHFRYSEFYRISGGIILVLLGIWIGSVLFSDGYATNVYTEILSVVATILVLDRLNDWRETERLKKRLIREASSQSNEIAKNATGWIRHEGWLTTDDDTRILKASDLSYANLQDVDLRDADLKESLLWFANLQNAAMGDANLQSIKLAGANLHKADLGGTNLKDADLRNANLSHANLGNAYLENTNLSFANLQKINMGNAVLHNANLWGADLNGAYLANADLRGADLQYANLENAIWHGELYGMSVTTNLPDGSKWTENTDMERFTDYRHPDFWKAP